MVQLTPLSILCFTLLPLFSSVPWYITTLFCLVMFCFELHVLLFSFKVFELYI
jgi:hypothetical protein